MVSPCRVSSSPCMLGSPSLEKGRWENMAVKSGLAGVVVQDSPSVALLMVFEVVEALGTLANGKPGVDVGGTGLVAVVCGEMANSGFLICSSCFTLLLSLLMNHSITFLSSVFHSVLYTFLHLGKLKIHSLSKKHFTNDIAFNRDFKILLQY